MGLSVVCGVAGAFSRRVLRIISRALLEPGLTKMPLTLITALLPWATLVYQRPMLRAADRLGLTRSTVRRGVIMVATNADLSPATVAAPRMPQTWVPLASDCELDPERPTPVRYLNQRYVIWRDNEGQWCVMDDACSHRLAPLSEGRIDRESGTLECAYHGWQFGGCGSCKRIPQAHGGQEDRACGSSRSAVRSYPTQVEKALIWFWPWSGEPTNAPEASPQHMVESVAVDAGTYTRDLPYGWDTLLENIADPSHIPFAHHGLQGTRDDAIPLNVSAVEEHGEAGFKFHFEDRTMGKMRAGTGEFRAPCKSRFI
jgi:phenylpropionate dioxygenase-like ring-hydroxylating dioxygenase large terminal subunit